jgi:hypothetical protein
MSAEWSDLHDAVFERLTIEWPSRELALTVRGPDGRYRIVATRVSHFACPQRDPWGTSKDTFVNEAKADAIEGGGTRLTIETQNGDELICEAERIELAGPLQGHA